MLSTIDLVSLIQKIDSWTMRGLLSISKRPNQGYLSHLIAYYFLSLHSRSLHKKPIILPPPPFEYSLIILLFHYYQFKQLMSAPKTKQKLRHYKSLENLYNQPKENSAQKKSNKNANNDLSKMGKNLRKYGSSRFPTEINDRIITKQESAKYSQLFKSQAKGKKEDKKQKLHHTVKNNSTTQLKKSEKNKPSSPIAIKHFVRKEITEYEPLTKMQKKDKKPLKKEKTKMQHNFQKSTSKIQHIESVFLQKYDRKSKNSHSKSRERNSRNKSKKKPQKLNTEFSIETMPSRMVGEEVEIIELVGQGTFGKVFRGRLRKTGEIIAIKRVLQDSRYKNREIEIIKILKNDFIVEMLGSYITYEGGLEYLNIMMKYYEESMFKRIGFYRYTRINGLDAKIILYQLFKGLSYLHSLGVCHRDIKPENVLLKGSAAVICDFGSAKLLSPNETNISYICARCYRAPQLIFGATRYSTVIDIWSAGCVILELLNGEPLFIGQTSVSHLLEIIKVMGTPTQEEVLQMNPQYNIRDYRFPTIRRKQWRTIFPDTDELLLNLLQIVMVYNPSKRAKAVQALAHDYFNELRDKFTYQHIKCQFHLKDFFNFSEKQLNGFSHLRDRLIPKWYFDSLR